MADPKYAGLPGIVHDQPDVYETSELPESEQHDQSDLTESSDDALEILKVSAKEAHTKFADKILDADKVDFSDRISKRNRTGYRARPIEWNLSGDGKEEDVVSRYNRLMCEVTALQEEILQAKGDDVKYSIPIEGDKVTESQVSGAELHQLSQQLLNQLVPLHSSLGVDSLETAQSASSHRALSELLETIKNAKKSESKVKDSKSKDVSGGSSLSYQMLYSPEISKLNAMAPTVEMEKRIEKLEKLLGNDPERVNRLWSWTKEGSVMAAVTSLGQKMALLDPSQLDQIEGRLHGVNIKMNSIAEKSALSQEKESKVKELFELVEKCHALSGGLPETVERLEALQDIHNEAAQFAHSLHQLSEAQTNLSSSIGSNDSILRSVSDKLQENLSSINSSIASLEKRVQALDKK